MSNRLFVRVFIGARRFWGISARFSTRCKHDWEVLAEVAKRHVEERI